MECKLSVENTRLIEEVAHWKKECKEERRSSDKVRDGEKEWFLKYELIMAKLLQGDHIYETNIDGYQNFQHCLNTFIREFCKIKNVGVPELEKDRDEA